MGGPVGGRGAFVAEWPPYDKNTLNGFALFPSFHDPSFIAHACIVETDKDTGIVKVVKEYFPDKSDITRNFGSIMVRSHKKMKLPVSLKNIKNSLLWGFLKF